MNFSSRPKLESGIDCPDKAFEKAGAKILPTAADVFAKRDMIVKVKEPQAARNRDAESRGTSCSPTYTWLPTSRRPRS